MEGYQQALIALAALLVGGIAIIARTVTTMVRAKHGYPLEGKGGAPLHKLSGEMARQHELLAAENEKLKAALLRVEERVAVLERIVTEPGARLAKEIETLR